MFSKRVLRNFVLVIVIFSMISVGSIAPARPVYAQWATISTTIADVPRMIQDAITKALKTVADTTFKNQLSKFLNNLAYNAATRIATGEKGQKPLFEVNFDSLLNDVRDQAIGNFAESLLDSTSAGVCEKSQRSCTSDRQCDEYVVFKDGSVEIYNKEDYKKSDGSYSVPANMDRFEREKCKLGPMAQLGGLNICSIPDPLVEVKIQTLALDSTKRGAKKLPTKLCGYQEIKKNFDTLKKVKSRDLVKVSSVFRTDGNDLGLLLRLNNKKNLDILETEKAKELEAKINQGVKPVKDKVTGVVKTPAKFVSKAFEKVGLDGPLSHVQKQTGSAVADAIGVFTSTLISKSLDTILNKGLNPATDPKLAKQKSGAFSIISGIAAAKLKFANLLRADDIKTTGLGATALLDQLSSGCDLGGSTGPLALSNPDAFRDVNNCVIDALFRQAIDQKLTVKQAVDEGLFAVRSGGGGSKIFATKADGKGATSLAGSSCQGCESGIISWRSIIILRKYRIVPVGWELAARYILEVVQSDPDLAPGTKQEWTLEEVMNNYNNENSPFYGMVDPDWILKAPVALKEKRYPGENIISEDFIRDKDTNGDNKIDLKDKPTRVVKRGTQIASEETCIYEDGEGCAGDYFGQCVEEAPIWRVDGELCAFGDGTYNSCQSYVRTDTNTAVSYITKTTSSKDCTEEFAGCRKYERNKDAATGDWIADGDSIYLDRDKKMCDAINVGCTEYIRLADISGAVLPKDDIQNAVTKVINASGDINDYEKYGLVSKVYLNDAPSCLADETSCRSYTPVSFTGSGTVAGVVSRATVVDGAVTKYNGECPRECVDYEPYTEHAFGLLYPKQDTIKMIASTGEQCSATAEGCTEFTNLSDVSDGGEQKLYYSEIRECVTEDATSAKDYFTWEGSEDTGFQLRNWKLDSTTKKYEGANDASVGGPRYPKNSDGDLLVNPSLCNASINGLLPEDPAYNPDCREYLRNTGAGTVARYYRLHSSIVFASNECQPLRRTLTDVDGNGVVNNNDCTQAGGTITSSGDCLHYTMRSQARTCNPQEVSCRKYSSTSAANARLIVDDTFEQGNTHAWLSNGGTSPTVSGNALNSGEYSLKASSGNPFYRPIEVLADKKYVIELWAMGETFEVSLEYEDGTKMNVSGSNLVPVTAEWKRYIVGPFTSVTGGLASLTLTPSSASDIYIDNVVVRESNDLYLIQNSWTTPLSCDVTIDRDSTNPASHAGSPTANESQLYCQEYRDDDTNDTIFIKEFNKLCNIDKVGCEPLIRTYETDVSISQKSVIGGIVTPADTVEYVVNKKKYACASSEAGCTELGQVSKNRNGDISYDTNYVILDPDNEQYGYEDALCESTQELCLEYSPSGSSAGLNQYFKDPQDRVCEFKQGVSLTDLSTLVSGWFKVNSAPYDSSDICEVEGQTPAVTVCDANSPVDGCYTYTCPQDQSSCTEFQDPLSPKGCDKNLLTLADRNANPDKACDFYYLLKDTLTEGRRDCQYVDKSNGCVGFFETNRGDSSKFLRADCQSGCPYSEDANGNPQLLKADCTLDKYGSDPESKPGCLP